ncbi:Crp/Fnr family transcriptional regulator, partial [Thioclava sp. BHET1]
MTAVNCKACPLRRQELFDDFSEDELAFMLKFKSGELQVSAGSTIVMEGSNIPQLYT